MMLRIGLLATAIALSVSLVAIAGTRSVEVVVYRSGECGSWREAVATVKAGARELGMKVDVRVVTVHDVEEARKLGFHGSPSVVVAGVDVEGPDVAMRSTSFG